MDLATITAFFTKYGAIAIFVIVFLEYLNLPGFPAGIIMPLSGVFASRGEIAFPIVMLLTVGAGVLGSLVLYFLGFLGGELFLKKYMKKFPKQAQAIEKALQWLKERGVAGVFLAKLLPMIRTLISIPAGVMKMQLSKYLISSAAGVFLWNLFFVGAGYLLGDAVFAYF